MHRFDRVGLMTLLVASALTACKSEDSSEPRAGEPTEHPDGSGTNGGDPVRDSGTSPIDVDPDADASVADAQVPYNPCPAKGTPCVILPLGDSITDGVGSSGGGYRVPLFRLALAHQQSITFVGNGANGPNMVDDVVFPKNHEGHSGFTIDDGGGRKGIHSLTAPAMQKFHPHIVTLMIGTNDVSIQLDLPNLPKRLGGDPDGDKLSLIDTILTTDPNVLLVVAQIVPTTDDTTNTRVKAYNDAIPALVQKRVAQGKHIMLVDMYSAFTANPKYKTEYMNDTLHPKDAGYAKMADVWYAAIGSFFR